MAMVGARAAAACLLLSTGCTDTPVHAVDPGLRDKVAIVGNFCTSRPDRSDHPVRVLFAVDSSSSMVVNDPNDIHVDAIEFVVDQLSEAENVEFGIIRWGERIVRELVDYNLGDDPDLFTNDKAILGEAYTRMRQDATTNPDKYLGGTDYEEALDAVRDYIVQDVASNPENGFFAQYYIEFMTDGMPQSGNADPDETRDAILAKIADMTGNYNLRLDVISIVEIATVPPEFFNLLPEMAEQYGGGTFIQLATPDALDEKLAKIVSDDLMLYEFDLATFSVANDPKALLVANLSSRIADVGGVIDVYPDSDYDGLVDPIEEQIGTNPQRADSDGDGLGDLFEVDHRGEFDPLAACAPPLSEEQLSDNDNDGLVQFIENRLGTDPEVSDTDADGVADGIEYMEGMSPKEKDLEADADGDGISNAFELRQHTNPVLEEPPELRADRRYVVEPLGDPDAIYDGRRCYEYRVGNVTLSSTLASVGMDGIVRPAGYNQIEVRRLERPLQVRHLSGLAAAFTSRAVIGNTFIIFRALSESVALRDPPALELQVRDAVFDP